MDFEKLPQISDIQKQEIIKSEIEKPNRSGNLLEQEKRKPYLEFNSDEENEVVKKVTEELCEQGHDIGNNQIEFPHDKEELEDWIYEYSKYFTSQRLVEVAIKNSEYAPKLTKELTDRKEYSQLEQILQQYKGGPIFEHCVHEIESGLSENELQDSVLMALSYALARTGEKQRLTKIAEHEVGMKAEKKTARSLEEYRKLLHISDEELTALQDKELLLVGGGLSPIKGELKKNGIECVVTNIDPIAEPNKEIADKIIKSDFFDMPLEESKYNEVFALHSLPTYAFTPEQVKDFYRRSILSLRQNGVLRVMPINKFSDSFTPEMRLSRKPVNNASVNFIERLKEKPELFSIAEFTVEHKGFFGKKTEMPGVRIQVIGGNDKIKEFLG